LLACLPVWNAGAQAFHPRQWRQATDAELHSIIPARAPVVTERIETDMSSANGITNGHGKYIAEAVLITAGYSAEGKYSRFFITQVPLTLASSLHLSPGEYLIAFARSSGGILIHFFEAATGKPVGAVLAKRMTSGYRVESFRIWPPADHSVIQIGRFTFSYQIGG
jgi:hypothetical protein